MTFLPIKPIFSRCTNEKQRQPTNKTIENRAKVLRPWLYYCLYRKYISYNIQSSYLRVLVRREGFEPPAFWSVGCLAHKSESFRLRFVLFATVHSADLPLFPSSPARFFRVLGQKWVRGCNIRRDWRTATLRHSPHYLSSYHKWRKNQRFVGVFVPHGSCFGLGDRAKVTTADIVIRCGGVAPR